MYESAWVTIAYVFTAIMVPAYLLFTVVVTVGGIIDLVYMFRELNKEVVDETDDGRVIKPENT